MASESAEALVLHVSELGESDRWVRLLTPERGRVRAVAKGAKRSVRRFAGTLDLFHRILVQLERRPRSGSWRLEQARLLDPHLGLRRRPERFALACALIELIDRLAPEGGQRGDAKQLFDFAVGALRLVSRTQPDARLHTLLLLRALAVLGLRPELGACVRCGRALGSEGRVGFHVGEGGAVCGACRPPGEPLLEVHLGTLRALAQGLRLPLERIERLSLPPAALAEAHGLTRRFLRFHVGFELRSEAFLARLLEPRARVSNSL